MDFPTGPVKVTFSNGDIFWAEFYSAYDVCVPTLYKTFEEMNNNSGNHILRKCNCGSRQEEVTLYTPVDDGFLGNWDGEACRKCMCITKGYEPYEKDYPFDVDQYLERICN